MVRIKSKTKLIAPNMDMSILDIGGVNERSLIVDAK